MVCVCVCVYVCVCVRVRARMIACVNVSLLVLLLQFQVHSECKEAVKGEQCNLGQHQHFIVPPSIIRKADHLRKGLWEVRTVCAHTICLLVTSDVGFEWVECLYIYYGVATPSALTRKCKLC